MSPARQLLFSWLFDIMLAMLAFALSCADAHTYILRFSLMLPPHAIIFDFFHVWLLILHSFLMITFFLSLIFSFFDICFLHIISLWLYYWLRCCLFSFALRALHRCWWLPCAICHAAAFLPYAALLILYYVSIIYYRFSWLRYDWFSLFSHIAIHIFR